MSVFKQVHMKFWQNDFVLGLTMEERYFYIYLITNSMTNQCGIYKLNRRLAELETGYSGAKIELLLKKFEEYGKVIVSKTSTEIMLVNWFKHNFKSTKKALQGINKELKDVKDKEFLKMLYDFCVTRQYPVAEIFNGIIELEVEREKDELQVKKCEEAALEIEEEVKFSIQGEESKVLSSVCEQITATNVPIEIGSMIFTKPQKRKKGLKKHKPKEEDLVGEALVSEEYEEAELGEAVEGTPVAFWSFSEDTKVETKW